MSFVLHTHTHTHTDTHTHTQIAHVNVYKSATFIHGIDVCKCIQIYVYIYYRHVYTCIQIYVIRLRVQMALPAKQNNTDSSKVGTVSIVNK